MNKLVKKDLDLIIIIKEAYKKALDELDLDNFSLCAFGLLSENFTEEMLINGIRNYCEDLDWKTKNYALKKPREEAVNFFKEIIIGGINEDLKKMTAEEITQ